MPTPQQGVIFAHPGRNDHDIYIYMYIYILQQPYRIYGLIQSTGQNESFHPSINNIMYIYIITGIYIYIYVILISCIVFYSPIYFHNFLRKITKRTFLGSKKTWPTSGTETAVSKRVERNGRRLNIVIFSLTSWNRVDLCVVLLQNLSNQAESFPNVMMKIMKRNVSENAISLVDVQMAASGGGTIDQLTHFLCIQWMESVHHVNNMSTGNLPLQRFCLDDWDWGVKQNWSSFDGKLNHFEAFWE